MKEFREAELEVIAFSSEDVIATSTGGGGGDINNAETQRQVGDNAIGTGGFIKSNKIQ